MKKIFGRDCLAQFLEFILLYLPSFLSRYSIQLMIVALPWLMQARKANMNDISMNFAWFFTGSLVMTFLAAKVLSHLNIKSSLIISIVIVSLLSFASLLIIEPTNIAIIRFLQGGALAFLRPLSKIWLIEFKAQKLSVQDLATRSSWSQILISVGTILGGWFGARFGMITGGMEELVLFSAILLLSPMLLFIVAYVIYFLAHKEKEKIKTSSDKSAKESLTAGFKFFLRMPKLLLVLILYLLSLTAFKVLIIAFPFHVRSLTSSLEQLKSLELILVLQPIAFLFGNWFLSKILKYFKSNHSTGIILICISTTFTALLPWLTVYTNNMFISGIFICFGGGLLSGFIYPLLIYIIGDEMNKCELNLKRQIILVTSLVADIGQFFGILLLSLSVFEIMPLHSLFVVLALTVMAIIFFIITEQKRRLKILNYP
ncbi:MFS transporter [Fluviispira vulneris]|uniref:MFS transporter n=1 Tax=Fluviispira vulneris TaxID=2763012 RepID=UPI00164902CA|nr:MFS transporter [Fluviispira vulneris]